MPSSAGDGTFGLKGQLCQCESECSTECDLLGNGVSKKRRAPPQGLLLDAESEPGPWRLSFHLYKLRSTNLTTALGPTRSPGQGGLREK